ncbi:protein FRG2-like-2 [Meriones unguiculatus]|uniref:protein FRG2-like-2 n=1 Tax=Meriones unguiculatus TaxID=10047 RepID=UPI000B4F1571|nr:protein FRG2-like-2 [Meriones unguiculatus]
MSPDFLAPGNLRVAVLGSILRCLCVPPGAAVWGGAEGVEDTVTYTPLTLPISAQMMENPRKRKHSPEDCSQVRTGNEAISQQRKRPKTSVKKTEPDSNGLQGGSACRPEPQHSSPPPLRKNLVTFLRAKAEETYGAVVQLQAQQHGRPFTQEQLSRLTQLSASLRAMVHTFYSMATQAGFVFPAQAWLVPASVPVPRELSEDESQSPCVEGGDKIADPPAQQTSPEPGP